MLAIRGRRGAGKSTLVEEFLLQGGTPHAFFSASKGQRSDEALAAFLDELEASTLPIAGELAAGVRPSSWEGALRLIAATTASSLAAGMPGPASGTVGARRRAAGPSTATAGSPPACLVIDELPWLAEQEQSIEGLLQTIWDRQLRRMPILVVLIGSDLHMMRDLERYDRPLHGRLRPLVVEPLNPAEVADMTKVDATTALDAYCILGGFPQLAATWRAGDTIRSHLERELADPTSPLVVAGERIVAAELPPQSSARAVAGAIGAGETEFTKILNRSNIGRTSLSNALSTLAEKRIVSRDAPFASTGEAKLHRYTIADPYLRFWLKFIAPNMPVIERRRGDLICERILDDWNAFRGRAIEPIVRASIERMLPDSTLPNASYVSSYWTRTNRPQVDLVGSDGDRSPTTAAFIGSIKWRERRKFSRADAVELASIRPQVPLTGPQTQIVGVSRTGFEAGVQLDGRLGPADLLSAWR